MLGISSVGGCEGLAVAARRMLLLPEGSRGLAMADHGRPTYGAGMPHHDLVVIGTGSGNTVVDDGFADLDVAIIEQESRFGGTCLNVGCIPTKMLAYTAEVADTVRGWATYGVDADLRAVRWEDVRDRVFGRLDPLARAGRDGRIETDWITVHTGHARFTAPRTLAVGSAAGSGRPVTVTADRIVIATGSRPLVPPPVADSRLPYETSDTIMRRDRPPRRLAILGGGYIAVELANVFAAAGAEIVMIEKAGTLLGPQDETVAREFTGLARKRYELRLGQEVTGVSGQPGALRTALDDGSTVDADTLLVAVGRIPNGDLMDLDRGGIDVDDQGLVVVDDHQATTADGVWALGDVCTPVPLKHVANREADVVRLPPRGRAGSSSASGGRGPQLLATARSCTAWSVGICWSSAIVLLLVMCRRDTRFTASACRARNAPCRAHAGHALAGRQADLVKGGARTTTAAGTGTPSKDEVPASTAVSVPISRSAERLHQTS
jgi:mycothione reductase